MKNSFSPQHLQAVQQNLNWQFSYPGSQREYLSGSRDDIRVPIREIIQSDTITPSGHQANPPIPVYDTSGAYGDPDLQVDLKQGLSRIRENWIAERGDTEVLAQPSSRYGRDRMADEAAAHLRFQHHIKQPRRAQVGQNVSQMHYTRQGIITPEMEFVAIRERMKLDELFRQPAKTD